MLEAQEIRAIALGALGRQLSSSEVDSLATVLAVDERDGAWLTASLSSSSEAVNNQLRNSMANHLFLIHRARVGLMAAVLPPARRILDLGGANAPLCDAGYQHSFDELVIVDLPPEDRHDEFAGRIVTDRQTPQGPVRVAYTSMTDLSMFEDGSIDLVWSGQSIEHITVDDARAVYREVRRVLSPDGWFCLDTPNRLVTKVHAEGNMIHPDHRHEYEPAELIGELESAGFTVEHSYGVCDMPLTVASQRIDYRDFVLGAGVTTALDSAYIQYHACRVRG